MLQKTGDDTRCLKVKETPVAILLSEQIMEKMNYTVRTDLAGMRLIKETFIFKSISQLERDIQTSNDTTNGKQSFKPITNMAM